MMDKTDLLLRMMEQPHEYSEQQWQEILADEACRELYTLMSDVNSACHLQREVSDEEMAAEWRRLQKRGRGSWLRIAAMFIGIVMLSGIAFAAIHMVRHQQRQEKAQSADTLRQAAAPARPTLRPAVPQDTAAVVFDNVALDKIITQIAAYHHMEAEIADGEARDLRFYFVWRQQDCLSAVVEQLNQFQRVNIVVERAKLIVR